MRVDIIKISSKHQLKDETVESEYDYDIRDNKKWVLKYIEVDEIMTKAEETKKNQYEEQELKYVNAAKEAARASKQINEMVIIVCIKDL